jgi:hypothetical protein
MKLTVMALAGMAWASLFHMALVVLAVGFAVEFRSGIPLLALGAGLVVFLFRANYEAARVHVAHQEAHQEAREVAKLAFEAAIRKNRVTGTDPTAVLMATMQAASMGVTQDELKEISDRVGGEHGEHMRTEDE